MIDVSIITAIITGSFALTAIILKNTLMCLCPTHEDKDGNNLKRPCYVKCKCCKSNNNEKIPLLILDDYYEPHHSNSIMFHTILEDDNSLSVDLPGRLKMTNDVDNGSVNIFKTFKTKSSKGEYCLEMYLKNVTVGQVKLFVKRFNNNYEFNKDYPVTYQKAVNNYNRFDIKSKLGTHGIQIEQVGIMIESIQTSDKSSKCVIEKVLLKN